MLKKAISIHAQLNQEIIEQTLEENNINFEILGPKKRNIEDLLQYYNETLILIKNN